MGFYEDDRIRRKNRAYNFPTPEINFEARKLIRNSGGGEKSRVLYFLKCRFDGCVDDHYRKILQTAIKIAEEEMR
jgi:hypothetical protein